MKRFPDSETPDLSEIVGLDSETAHRLYFKDKRENEEFPEHESEIIEMMERIGFYRNQKENKFVDLGQPKRSAVYTLNEYLKELGISLDEFYKLNRYGFRSDEFTDKHDGLHVLFAGCSITFGDSVPLEHSWAYKVYKAISENTKVSGYFNIGTPGMSISDIVVNIIIYIQNYGVPDAIFINFPDVDREIFLFMKETDADKKEFIKNKALDKNAVLLNFLSDVLSIKIYAFTWDKTFNMDPRRDLRSKMRLRPFSPKTAERHIYDFIQENKNHQYVQFAIKAMDDAHPGIAMHDFYYSFIYNEYLKDVKK